MKDIKYWENIIKERRKKTPFRKFVKEIASWSPLIMLYRRDNLISRFPDSPRIHHVVNKDDYEALRENFTNHGLDYGVDMPFQEQFQKLFQSIDFSNTISFGKNENTEYADIIIGSKDVYLSGVVVTSCEYILYSSNIKEGSRWIINSSVVMDHSENIYMSSVVMKGYNIFYSRFINNCNNIWFSTNLIGCSECFGCNWLQNQSYCINNKNYSKEDYFKYKNELLKKKSEYMTWYNTTLQILWDNIASKNITGHSIINSWNIENGYFIYNSEDGRNVILGGTLGTNQYIFDACWYGSPYGNHFYGVASAGWWDNYYLSCHISECSNIYYSYFLISCTFCLGCVGLKNKSFCILNKQYTKEEWYILADKIFSQMNQNGTLGDFFPGNMNPFYFNDTMAYLIDDSFSKEEVEKDGYMWRDDVIRIDIPEWSEIVRSNELDTYQWYVRDGNWQINPDIMTKVIVDKKRNYYKIVPMEYEFLMKHALPLPEIHWLERIKTGFRFQ